MTLRESKERAKETKPIEKDKFDRHMRRARKSDIESRQDIFVHQSERAEARSEKISGLKPSVY